ncbi:MAG: TonB-dependent receptor [Bacteroidetes bacterium]|nr:TonB-dependent receptor [Bacteroidota bacterium]
MSGRYFLLTCFLFASSSLLAQNKFTISGYVKDDNTGEFLTGANIYVKEILKGATSNQYGFYSITLDKGEHTLIASFLGFQDYSQAILLNENKRINIALNPKSILGKEVVITGEKEDKNIQSTEMGRIEMDVEQIKTLPAFMGEVDILKALQLLPGIQSAGEGNSGFYVRGGGPDQNLILLDEAVVYNASHLFGFFSVFNSDAVKNIQLIKGGMPANYGGRLASVIDVSMKEGNSKKLQVDGGLGLISSRLTIQGPLIKDTSSFIISGRRTYIDVLAKQFIKDTSPFKGSGYYFYDLNGKVNYRISDKDRLFLSGYFGRDVFSYRNKKAGFNVDIPWGNSTASARWNHLFNDKLFMNATAIFSDYQFAFEAMQSDFEFRLFSGIRSWNGKVDFNWFPSIRHNVKFGANYNYHTFTPSNATAKQGDVIFDTGSITRLYAHEAAIYITDEFTITDKLSLNAGIRYSFFRQVGPFNRFVKDDRGETTDTIFYNSGEKVIDHGGPEPRLSLRYALNRNSSIKASYTRNYQYIHMASLSAVSLPTDIWVPSTSLVSPQLGTQYAIGYFRNFFDNTFETSVELYYKEMKNQVEYKEGYLPENGMFDNPDQGLTFGDGQAYGSEFFIKKRKGKVHGWIGYTLSRTTRIFPEINAGKEFFAKFDRRHDMSVVLIYDLNPKWTFSAIFIYGTGNAITLPVTRYTIDGFLISEYGARNSFRMPAYHRADVSVTYNTKREGKFRSSWNFSVFNVYNRYNPYFIYFDNAGDISKGNLEVKAIQVSLFPILPSLTWNFSF